MANQKIPPGYHTVTPYLIVSNAAQALDFYKKAFGATEVMRMPGPGGKVMHAEIKIGDSPVMLADENPQWDARGPQSIGGTPVSLMIYVEDVDRVFSQAVAAGAKEIRPVDNQFYGDRTGVLHDPYGHKWSIATHVEDVPPAEMNRRMQEMMKSGQKP